MHHNHKTKSDENLDQLSSDVFKCLEILLEQIDALDGKPNEFKTCLTYCYFDMIDCFRFNFPSSPIPENLIRFEEDIDDGETV